MSAQHTPGPWRSSFRADAIVADSPIDEVSSNSEVAWYGGYLVAETVAPQNRPLIIAAPKLLKASTALWVAYDGGKSLPADKAEIDALFLALRDAVTEATGAAAQPQKVKCENCGKDADTKYDGDDMCRECATYCARRDFEEDDMPGGFA